MKSEYRMYTMVLVMLVFAGSLAAQNSRGAASDTVKVKQEEVIGTVESEPDVFVMVEEMPEFPGGPDSMMKFIAANIIYPDSALVNNIQGRVAIRFVVEESGD